ncbi:hypothetical protein [Polymorphospora sp. NPDC050346]|uniref:hypothetical protein n=1 Tax=Polymorphospora sp. NPDC050346 TaxID=3155780 RepID=UPI0033F5725D
MSGSDVAVVLDPSAVAAYARNQVAVGELLTLVADEGRVVGVPATCLAAAYTRAAGDLEIALLALLEATPVVRLLPLDKASTRAAGLTAGRVADGDIALGHAVTAAYEHGAHYATTDPATAAKVLVAGWSVLDLSE